MSAAGSTSPALPGPLVEVSNLTVHFRAGKRFFTRRSPPIRAVDDVTFAIRRGEILGLVGESGSGKTTVGRAILGLTPPTAGRIRFDGRELVGGPYRRELRRRMQVVFQDPISALNPRVNVGNAIAYPMKVHNLHRPRERDRRVGDLLELVGLSHEVAKEYPHELSSGDRQRLGIARALALEPEFLFLDEPVASLDVSMQAQILNLLRDIRTKLNLTMLFVSHNLAVVEYLCDRVAVMYLGRLCEVARADQLYKEPAHPYTLALMSAITRIDGDAAAEEEIVLEGEIPSPIDPPRGCRFHTRCFARTSSDVHENTDPPLVKLRPDHFVACHLYSTFGRESSELRRPVAKRNEATQVR